MSNKGNHVIVGGRKFSNYVYQYLLSRFKEAFSHSSLSVEQAFQDLERYSLVIETSMDLRASEYYDLLPIGEKNKIRDILHQIIVFKGSVFGVFSEKLTGDQRQIERLYNEHFKYFEKYLYYYLKFDKDGNFDKVATLHNLDILFLNLPRRRAAYTRAYNMKKDNLNAFDFAMKLDKITVPDVIKINSIVNYSDPDKVDGFKKTNNDILSSSFTPVDKENVPFEMQKLFRDYENGFGLEIQNPYEANIPYEEKMKRLYTLFEREAIFHIRFERIHPFNDGNGRTGRIIMNYHLLKQHLAPVLITEVLSDDYKKYINEYNVHELTKLLLSSSSQLLTNWVSIGKSDLHIRRNDISTANDRLAILDEFEDNDEFKVKRRKSLINRFNNFTLF